LRFFRKQQDESAPNSFQDLGENTWFDVHRARQYCFGLVDLIRYSQNPGEDLSTQVPVVETTPYRSFSITWVYRPKRILSSWSCFHYLCI